jgi:hypothetical protein
LFRYNNIEDFRKDDFDSWKENFKKTDLFKNEIQSKFHIHDFSVDVWNVFLSRTYLWEKVITLLPFYFIDKFVTKSDTEQKFCDLGCGNNLFKQFYPNVHGVDPHFEKFRDEELYKGWYKDNQKKWSGVISVNALHFVPINFFKQTLISFRDLLIPDAYGYLALNYKRVENFSKKTTPEANKKIIEETLESLYNDIEMCLTYHDEHDDDGIDGNIHILFKGKK